MTSWPDAAVLLAEMVALLVGVTFCVSLLQRRLGDETIRRWMGGPPRRAALKGIAVGFVTPFCTYSAIPVLVGMRQAGVRPAGYAAFMFAAPVVDPALLGVLAIVIGPAGAALYAVTAFAAAFLLAVIVDTADITRHLKPVPALANTPVAGTPAAAVPLSRQVSAGCESQSAQPWAGWRVETATAWRKARALLRSMAWLIAAGLAIGLGISLLVPPEALAGVAGADNPFAVPAAAAAGIPLYFGTEMFLPVGTALRNGGAGIGAVVALTIAGAGANIPEFALLTKVARGRLVAAFFAYVFAVAVAAGLVTELIL